MPLFLLLMGSIFCQSMVRTNRNGENASLLHSGFDAEAVWQVVVTGDLALDVCVEYLDYIYHYLGIS